MCGARLALRECLLRQQPSCSPAGGQDTREYVYERPLMHILSFSAVHKKQMQVSSCHLSLLMVRGSTLLCLCLHFMHQLCQHLLCHSTCLDNANLTGTHYPIRIGQLASVPAASAPCSLFHHRGRAGPRSQSRPPPLPASAQSLPACGPWPFQP